MTETNFKHTDLGLIPHDWEVKTLADVGTIRMCKRVMKYQTSESGDIPFFKIGTFGKQADAFISKELYNEFRSKYNYPKKGDILLSAAGTIGRTVVFDGKPAYFQDSNIVWIENNEQLVVNSLLYYIYHRVNWVTDTGTIPRIYNGNVSAISFPLSPTLAEQERIAGALSSIDTLIGALTEQIEKKRHIKQGAMQQLLTGKKRLAGFTGEWITETIKDVCDRYDHLRVPVAANLRTKGLTPYYGANGIQDYVDGYTHDGEFILLAEDGANNLVDYPIQYVSGRIWVNNHAHVLSAKEKKANNRFLAYVLKTIDFESNIVGSGRAKLNAETLMQLEITIPPTIAEQSAIAAVLSRMDVEIAALEQKRDKYTAIKQGMMQQLLTGRIRLLEEETQEKPIVQTIQPLQKQRTANVFFRRSVLAAEIADRLCEKRRFGHVKMEKLIFMTEKMCGIDLASHYHRDAAGPYDNRALRSIDSQLKKQKWFEAKSITDENGNRRYTYMPLANRGGHKQYFDLYYADVLPEFDNVINTMADWDTEHCEIIATLYSAWEDLLHTGNAFTDDDILNELYHRWHDSKKRFSAPRLLSALTWMRQNNFIPKQ